MLLCCRCYNMNLKLGAEFEGLFCKNPNVEFVQIKFRCALCVCPTSLFTSVIFNIGFQPVTSVNTDADSL